MSNTTKKTYKTSLREIFTPGYDVSTGGTFTGNHTGFYVTLHRTGDQVVICTYGEKGLGPVRPLLKRDVYSVKSIVGVIKDACREGGLVCLVENDMPEGFSLPLIKS